MVSFTYGGASVRKHCKKLPYRLVGDIRRAVEHQHRYLDLAQSFGWHLFRHCSAQTAANALGSAPVALTIITCADIRSPRTISPRSRTFAPSSACARMVSGLGRWSEA